MMYLFHRALLRVQKNGKKYIPMGLQIIVGVCLLSISLSLAFNSFQQMSEFSSYLKIPFAGISTDSSTESSGITKDDLLYLKKNYAGNRMAFYKQYLSVEPFTIVFADSDFFSEIMGMKTVPSSGIAVAGQNALDALRNWTPADPKLAKFYSETNGTFFGHRVEEIVSLETMEYKAPGLLSAVSYTTDSLKVPSFDDVIIFPLEDSNDFDCQSILALLFNSPEGTELHTPLNEIQTYLLSVHPNSGYVVRNYGGEVQQTLGRNEHLANTLAILAGFILVIVFFGLVGLLLVLLNKRRQEYAITLMCGANHTQLMFEAYLEIFLFVICSTLIGSFLSIPFLPFFSSMGVPVSYSVWTLVICTLGAILISMAVCIVSFYRIMSISPVNVLKDL